jgi:hypothetical protein
MEKPMENHKIFNAENMGDILADMEMGVFLALRYGVYGGFFFFFFLKRFF